MPPSRRLIDLHDAQPDPDTNVYYVHVRTLPDAQMQNFRLDYAAGERVAAEDLSFTQA